MYKQLEKLITLTNNDLNFMNRDLDNARISHEQLNLSVFYLITIAYHSMI